MAMKMADANMPPTMRQVFEALLLCTDMEDVAWVTQAQIAKHTGLSPNAVRSAIRRLRAADWIGEPVSERLPDGFIRYGFEIHRNGPAPA
jgi:DNA-binding MarR family transcriptional regulator